MATEHQIEANRKNASLSTGPKTPEGKRRAAGNAVTYGLFSRQVLLPGEDAEKFQEVAEALLAELEPVGEMEHLLVDELVTALWRRRRLIGVEAALFRRRMERIEHSRPEGERQVELPAIAQAVVADQTLLANLDRYEARLGRNFYHALHELQRRQAERAGERVPAPAVLDVNVAGEVAR